METRELRYFVAVASEQHVGRAAERLGIAQPPLSRAIRQLERRLGGALFERHSRGVRLTPAGRVLLEEARAALDAVEAAERRARRATAGRPGLVLVSKAGAAQELLGTLLDAYAAEPGASEVEVVLCDIGEQAQYLRDGRADVALLHRPFDNVTGFDTIDLLRERQVAVLPAAHPWATRGHLTMSDLASVPGVPALRWPHGDGTFPEGPGPQLTNGAQLYQLVALGRAFTLLPESALASHQPGIATVPVVDSPEVTTVIAWPAQSRSLPLAALIRTAEAL